MKYRILRFYSKLGKRPRIIKTNLTYEEAIEHCNDPETSSLTCTNQHRKDCIGGDWFDGFERYK